MSQFVDGAPLDASLLSSLETKLSLVEGKVITVGDSTIGSSAPQMLAGTFDCGDLDSGKTVSRIIPLTTASSKTFFSKVPTVVATLASPKGGLADDNINIAIGQTTKESVTIWIYFQSTNKTKKKPVSINWIALAY